MVRLGVRLALLAVAFVGFAAAARADDSAPAAQWPLYRDRFIGDDGRVRDTGNDGISHTEGQGWAMLFAESFGDRETFDRVWKWTHDNLKRPNSMLFSWRWDPEDDKVADTNNATDGDMLIAWALLRAARRWHVRDDALTARRMLVEIRRKLVVRVAGRLVLLPGGTGFIAKDGTVTVNPSYYIYPALRDFPRLDGSPTWLRLTQDGLWLLARARFGTWHLTPDWVALRRNGAVAPAEGPPQRFGYDAIRIPLYLVWGGVGTRWRLADDLDFWDAFTDKPIPAWVDVADGKRAPFAAPSGFQAIIGLVRQHLGVSPPAGPAIQASATAAAAAPAPGAAAALPQIGEQDDYYSASLILLAGMAREAAAR